MHITLHFNAMVGKHMAVVFDVLTQFACLGVLQPGLEFGQHLIAWELGRCIGVAVGQRDVARHARFHAERDTHDFGAHFV